MDFYRQEKKLVVDNDGLINFEKSNCLDRNIKKLKLQTLTREEINRIIDDSFIEIKKIHKDYNSRHEAYGYFLEEFEEGFEEIEDIRTGILEDYWNFCRNSKKIDYGDKAVINLLKAIRSAAVCCAVEMVHVGIVACRALELEEKEAKK